MMSPKEAGEVLDENQSQDFNPIQTFGNRSSNGGLLRKQKDHHAYDSSVRGGQNIGNSQQVNDDARGQTRIRLLSSYQQSYLQSVSQPMFTDADQPSQIRSSGPNCQLSYSQSKRSGYNNPGKYLNTDPINQLGQDKGSNFQTGLNYKKSKSVRKQGEISEYASDLQKINKLKDKIKILAIAIQQETYLISIQDRLSQFISQRIDQRGRNQKKRDHHQIVQRAIDFMDSSQDFFTELMSLSKMHNY